MEFEWYIFPGFTTLELCTKVQELLSKMSVTLVKFTGRSIFMSMFNDISWDLKTFKKNASQVLNSFISMRRELEQDNGHSSDLDQRKSGTLLVKTVHKENGTELQSKWCWQLQKADTQSSDPRVHYPEECLRAKVVGICQYTNYCADPGTIETVFRTLISVNQLSIYGTVAEMCEEYDSCHNRIGRLFVEGQCNPSFVPSVMKTHILLTDDLVQEEDLLQRF